ncbi:S9 family peptidase [Streptomyces sp. XD-27]|uniref:alpha/beta hydrolase family protein n=1 Tax=Streptomyces sp. XD-27 TaxID=3062779 RepID=UPI0026F451A3|nr:alpha/beta hydrolase [Streptomyces sp. XD-27]WKX71378.1 alpha/beta hydrolase [Streptomyces sp. XD-27]
MTETAAPTAAARISAVAGAAALLLSLSAAPAPAAPPTTPPTAPRGTLLSVTPLGHASRADVVRIVSGAGVDAAAARHGTDSYRLTYATITPFGAPTTASALLVLPDGGGDRLSTVSETHGTIAYRGSAPSTGDDSSDIGALLYASGGRAVVAPDYLGLGTGPGTHPYVDTASSVSASVDALRAARTAAGDRGRRLTADVYATGFSQGGQVAMALGRELARGAEPRFRLRALAPVAGPYDIEGQELPAIFDGRVKGRSGVFYLTYFLVAQNRLWPLYADPRDAFRAPYADRVEGLFDGEHRNREIVEQLPGSVEELLTAEWYERLQHPTGALAEVLRRNDGVCAWAPRVPVRLHTARGDQDVPIGNTVSCAKTLAERGAHATVLSYGDSDHHGTYQRAVASNARWFARLDQFRSGQPR